MKILYTPIITIYLAIISPTWAGTSPDPICDSIKSFVDSVRPDEIREVTFRTVWGGNFKGVAEPVLFAKNCDHNGYELAKAVCLDLMEYGAVEFAATNALRVVSCLSPQTHFAPEVSFENGAFSLSHGNSNRGSLISVEYSEDSSFGGMALRVSVDGY